MVDRLKVAAAPRAFNYGLARAEIQDWTHVVKLDGDIELPPDYFERILEEYAREPELGMAAGNLIEPRGGRMVPMPIPRHHIHGALKCYTRACFDDIGGVQTRLGWDTIDETYARLRGYTTRNYDDIIAIHHRPHASADGTLRGRARHGECAYIAHFSPLWVALRSLKVARDRPFGSRASRSSTATCGRPSSASSACRPGVPQVRPFGAARADAPRGARSPVRPDRLSPWISAATSTSCSPSAARR